jgi:hypothetical protein
VARSVYGGRLGARLDALEDGRLRFEYRIPDEWRDSSGYFRGSIGALRAYPRLVGQPAARVEAEHRGRHHVFIVSPGCWETASSMAVDALRLPLAELLRARVAGPEPTPADIIDAIEIGYGDAPYREAAHAIGERLLGAASLEAVVEELRGVIEERLCCSSFAFWVRRGAAVAELVARGASPAEPPHRVSLPLALGGREVGVLELDLHPQNEDSRRLVDALVPWIAAAVDRHLRPVARPELALDALPPWLGEIARLLCAGLSEKEVAARTGLSLPSVRTYVKRLYRRLGVRCRAELVASALAAR